MGTSYLLQGGHVIDGAGETSVPIKADIAIEDDRIKAIGELSPSSADVTINIKGLIACPGFIDTHAHSEFTLLADGRAEGKIYQGVTTEINGNCGLSAAPLYGPALEQRESDIKEYDIKERWNSFEEYFALLKKRTFAVNFATLTGHGNLRASAAGYLDKPLSETEKGEINSLLKASFDAGSKGISTGLIYPPGIFSDTPELIELARETARHKGIYATHMRSEGDRLIESIEEVITIAAASGVHAHISHLKTYGRNNWGKLPKVFSLIDEAHEKGIPLTCDRYPYIAANTDLDTILPSWAFEGGHKKEMQRLTSERVRLTEEILKEYNGEPPWESIRISSTGTDRNRWAEGKNLSEISRKLNRPPMDCFFDLLTEESLRVGAIFFSMNEDNLRSILKQPYTVIGTDSAVRSLDGVTFGGSPHPRGFGSFPRVLGKYTRDEKVLTQGEAIYKMTGLPAKIFNVKRRGIIREDFFADITVYDPDKIHDVSSFDKPFSRQKGIHHVFVNGQPVLLDTETTGRLPGRII